MTAILQYLENLAFIKNDTVYDIWYITNNLQNKLKSFFNYDTGGQFIFYPQLFKIDYKDIKITTPDINFLIVFNNQNNTKKIPHLYYNALEKFVEKNYHHSQILIYSHTIHLKISEYKIGLI
ncbi:MAG: hypothetical protein OEY79_04930, partial [Anaplasmataceae bacterium]|nr:hypothetical protein [Anaplasmataceae bacterium]